MAVDDKVLAQLAELMNSRNTTESTGTYLMGTVVESEGEHMVQIAGSGEVTPVIQAVDIRPGDTVMVFLKNHTATVTNNMTEPASGYGATEVATTVTELNDTVWDIDKELETFINTYESASEAFMEEYNEFKRDIAGQLGSTKGFKETLVTNSDGTKIKYVHDGDTLESSSQVWKYTADAIAMSIDGGKTYPYGFTVDGNMIMSKISVDDINALGVTAKDIYVGPNKETFIKANGEFQFAGINGIRYNPDTNKVTFGINVELTWDSISGTDDVLSRGDLDGYASKSDLDGYTRPNLLNDTDINLLSWKVENRNVQVTYDEDNDRYTIRYTGSQSSYYGITRNVAVQPDTTYSLSIELYNSCGISIKNQTSDATYNNAASRIYDTGRNVIPIVTGSDTNYISIYLYVNSSIGYSATVGQIKLELGDSATDYVTPSIGPKRITEITRDTISTTYINCSMLRGGEISGQKFVSNTEVDGDPTNLTITAGTYEDYGAGKNTNLSVIDNTFRYFKELGGDSFWRIIDNEKLDAIHSSGVYDVNNYYQEVWINGSAIRCKKIANSWIRNIFSVMLNDETIDIGYDPHSSTGPGLVHFDLSNRKIQFNDEIDATDQNLKIKTINGTDVSNFAKTSDLTPTIVTSFTASTGFANVTGSVKAFKSLGFAVVDLKVEVTDTIARGTAKQVLTIPSSVRPDSYRALTCVGYNTTAHRKLLINCYCNSSGAVYVMIPSNTDGSSNINGSDFTLSSSYSNMLSITGTYSI